MRISVALMNGSVVLEDLHMEPEDTVKGLRCKTAIALNGLACSLLSTCGLELEDKMKLERAGIENGDVVIAIVSCQLALYFTDSAFAAVKSDCNHTYMATGGGGFFRGGLTIELFEPKIRERGRVRRDSWWTTPS